MAAWGCNWEGSPVSFQHCLFCNIATPNKWLKLTAAEWVPMCNPTIKKNVRILNALCRPKKKEAWEREGGGEREREREWERLVTKISEIVRRLKTVNHCIFPVFIRFYWINSIKWAAGFAVHIFVYHSLVDEKFYSSGLVCCGIWNTWKFLTLKIKVPSSSKTSTNQEGVTNHETLIFNIWVLRRGLRYLRYHFRTFHSFYIWHKVKLPFLPARWRNFLKKHRVW